MKKIHETDPEVLALLLAEKSPEEIAQLKLRVTINRIAGILHAIACPGPHEGEGSCDYYIEDIVAERSKAQLEWQRRTRSLLAKAGITEEELDEVAKLLPQFLASAFVRSSALIKLLPRVLSVLRTNADLISQPVPPASVESGPLSSDESPVV